MSHILDTLPVDKYKLAINWWNNELSINEQNTFAKKHLLSYEVAMVIGNTLKYTSRKKYMDLILEVWEKEVGYNVNTNIATQYEDKILSMAPADREKEIKWVTDRLAEIDGGTFDVKRYLDNPIRFWFEEYRFVINKIQTQNV